MPDGGLHDAAEEVGGEAVLPGRSGLVDERNLRQPLDLLGGRQVAHVEVDGAGLIEAGLGERLLDGGIGGQLAIGEAGGVAEEVLNGHRPLRRDLAARGRDLHVLEGRQPLRDGIDQLQHAVLDQEQGCDRDHRLGHRVDAEDRVGPHRIGAGGIAHAEGPRVDEAALARNHHDGARELLVVDLLAEGAREQIEPGRGHPDALG